MPLNKDSDKEEVDEVELLRDENAELKKQIEELKQMLMKSKEIVEPPEEPVTVEPPQEPKKSKPKKKTSSKPKKTESKCEEETDDLIIDDNVDLLELAETSKPYTKEKINRGMQRMAEYTVDFDDIDDSTF